ncbi:hypothetical protein FOL47_008008 [Perkinsus chesapeaki]|uniref:Uncharacterized protein n=1 Tax=Perkinsus chesapeaki TaxID=330153 RepID=A0A7J6LGR5_PERCH|nr:hypothetical protein FOL47_008008 [Perkinsus chesapeaki]
MSSGAHSQAHQSHLGSESKALVNYFNAGVQMMPDSSTTSSDKRLEFMRPYLASWYAKDPYDGAAYLLVSTLPAKSWAVPILTELAYDRLCNCSEANKSRGSPQRHSPSEIKKLTSCMIRAGFTNFVKGSEGLPQVGEIIALTISKSIQERTSRSIQEYSVFKDVAERILLALALCSKIAKSTSLKGKDCDEASHLKY